MTVHRFAGKDMVVEFDARRCIHAGECVRGLPTVFDPQARPWVQPDHAGSAELATVVARCPTGALTLHRQDGSSVETAAASNTALIEANGPLYLRGRVVYASTSHAALAEYTRVALCRCGASGNKPFCDGSHRQAGFVDSGTCTAPAKGEPAAADARPGGPLKLNPIANGPLMVEGWIEFRAADGSTLMAGDKCWLCRCGASRNKPFCDGSHKAIGFTA